ncbi:uncharacterized protein ACR2FA_008552 [Aphomia sociella]
MQTCSPQLVESLHEAHSRVWIQYQSQFTGRAWTTRIDLKHIIREITGNPITIVAPDSTSCTFNSLYNRFANGTRKFVMRSLITLIFIAKFSLAQISGEFWWLNDKVTKLKGKKAPPPRFEDVNEFDTDETDKIIFRDDLFDNSKPTIEISAYKNETKNEKWKIDVNYQNENKIFWPGENKDQINNIHINSTRTQQTVSKYESGRRNEDQFNFYFPEDENSVCCILPLSKDLSKITFPGFSSRFVNRHKRSPTKDNTNAVLQQRNILLQRKYTTQSSNLKTRNTETESVIDEAYEDPYWNIKNMHLKRPNTQRNPINTKNNCHYQDYVEDYIAELPRPGLLGVYSDHGSPPNWGNQNKGPTYGGSVEEYDYVDEPGGYSSTIDPRRDTNLFKSPKYPRPLKTSTTPDVPYDPISQTVSYQSDPDFQVLQGFKLLNLARNKHKIYTKDSRKTTTETFNEQISDESLNVELNTKDGNDFERRQELQNCGRVLVSTKNLNVSFLNVIVAEQQLGNAVNGSHPWLGLVVLSRRRQGILCYATIVHPRAALTTADCVHGKTDNGGITIITGVWDLKDRSHSQSRVATTIIHPQYKPNDLSYNLAIMHWSQPLRLGVNVQPACLGEARLADDCKLFGWGGYDQGIRTRSRWQRASILTPHQCRARLSAGKRGDQLASDVFCASVQARGTVTGIGGPLICSVQGRHAVVGVAVWRDTFLVMMPAKDWALTTLQSLLDNF